MSDRFDITLERKLESKADEADVGGSAVRRIELITGTGRRRRWSDDDKARIVVESLQPGANVSEVARRNGLSPQQLFAWRREARALFNEDPDTTAAAQVSHVPAPQPRRRKHRPRPPAGTGNDASVFAPVVIAAPAPRSLPSPAQPAPASSGAIEIAIGDAVVRVSSQVETAVLAAVLRAVRRAS
jgi:transposase